MIVIVMALIGAVIGGLTARKRAGNGKDVAQYAVGYAIAFMIVGMILTVFVDRMLLS